MAESRERANKHMNRVPSPHPIWHQKHVFRFAQMIFVFATRQKIWSSESDSYKNQDLQMEIICLFWSKQELRFCCFFRSFYFFDNLKGVRTVVSIRYNLSSFFVSVRLMPTNAENSIKTKNKSNFLQIQRLNLYYQGIYLLYIFRLKPTNVWK